MRLAWKGFVSWLEVTNPEVNIQLQDTMTAAEDTLVQNPSQVSLENVLKNISFKIVLDKFEAYRQFLQNDNGKLSSFWMSYLDMVEILLGLIPSSTEGDWNLHLASIP